MLYDAYNRPVRTQELTREHAAPSLTGVRTLWNDTVASGLTPARLALLLREAAEGEHNAYLTLAEEMEERELHYACELGKRKLAVSRLPVTVEAVSDSPRDIELADAVRALVKQAGFRWLVKDLLDGLGKGFAVCEIAWDRSGSRWTPRSYTWRDPRFFQFDQLTRSKIRLRDEADLAEGIELAPFCFITHTPRLKSGIPIRSGLARLAAWAFMCKSYSVKDWLAFAEVYGMPLRLGKYDSGATPEDKAVLRMAVANLGSDAAAIFPKGMEIELVEAGKGAGTDFFERLANYFDAQLSKGILGQTASASGTPGKLGDEKLQAEVRDDIRDDDAEQLEETLQRDLVKAFIDLNYGPQENYPQLQLRAVEKEDTAALVLALKELVPLGLRVEQSVVRDKIGLPDPDKNAKPEDLLGAPATAVPAPPVAKAANREQPGEFTPEQQALEELADRGTAAATQALRGIEERLVAVVRESASYEEAMEKVLALWPEMHLDDLAALLEACLIGAQGAGVRDAGGGD